MNLKISLVAMASALAVGAVAQYSDPIEGLTNPLISVANGWNVQAGAFGSGASLSTTEKSPRNGSTQAIKQVGGSTVSENQRIWRNFTPATTLNSGVYIWDFDFKVIAGSGGSYFLRNRLDGVNNNFGEQVTTVGILRNPANTGFFPGVAAYSGGGLSISYYLLDLDPAKWYRFRSVVDFDNHTTYGPTIIDITDPASDLYMLFGTISAGHNSNIDTGFYTKAEGNTFGAGPGTPVDEGWFLDNHNFVKGGTVTGSATLENYSRPLDADEEGVVLYFETTGGITFPVLTPGGGNGEGTFSTVVAPGTYTVYAQGSTFLSKKVATGLVVTTAGATIPAFSLINGDVDGDDVISVFDYIALSDAFDSVADVDGDPLTVDPSANWLAAADLDRDGGVSVFDYIILSDNFDKAGERP